MSSTGMGEGRWTGSAWAGNGPAESGGQYLKWEITQIALWEASASRFRRLAVISLPAHKYTQTPFN